MDAETRRAILSLAKGIALDVPATCVGGCGTPVAHWREECPGCRERRRLADRRLRLAEAYDSLAAMPWAEFGGPWQQRCNPLLVSTCRDWKPRDGGLVLLGPTGCGKTSSAIALARRILGYAAVSPKLPREWLRFAAGIRLVKASELVLARRQHPLGAGEPFWILVAKSASLLILDEVGYEAQTDTAIAEVADYRAERCLITITTSGRTPTEFADRYGDAVVRKLIGLGKLINGHEP